MDIKNKKQTWAQLDTIDDDGYYRHNECGTILLRVDKNTFLHNCYCYCKKCKKEIKLADIANGHIVKPSSTNKIISA